MKSKEINPDAFYKPSEIVKNKLIVCDFKYPYLYVLKLIKKGRLNAKNFGLGKTPHYKVRGSDLLEYKKNWE